jgi:hypothetical protein
MKSSPGPGENIQHQQEQTSDSVVEHSCDVKPSLQAAIAGLWPCLPPSCTLCRHHAATAAVMRLLLLYAALPPSCGPCHRHAVPVTVMRSLPPSCGPCSHHAAPATVMRPCRRHAALPLSCGACRHHVDSAAPSSATSSSSVSSPLLADWWGPL